MLGYTLPKAALIYKKFSKIFLIFSAVYIFILYNVNYRK